ncbi:amidohydrolase family protein [Lactobacillus sp. UCMA15818]|uniref:amidohydrolase family protein n=1 Tax=Lactobacillus sp. UCMA15818 TaxID=2583394 RepID=UPI0025AF290C|nr:amidohydrolase family protein [Lactobacillus sp. UCMA15818]MDN2453829.1 amidohydrolase family protein [Lactobacillus sp. UCMA15818]
MDLAEFVQSMPLLDHHCHYLISAKAKDRETRLAQVSTEAANSYPIEDTKNRLAWWTFKEEAKHFYKKNDQNFLQPFTKQEYIEYNRSIFRHYNYQMLLIDTGFVPNDPVTSIAETQEITSVTVYTIYRIETHAESWMQKENSFEKWWQALTTDVADAKKNGFVGFKSIAAYRFGLRLKKVAVADAMKAFTSWKESGRTRLTDATLICFILWNLAPLLVAQKMPLQFHVGYGDADTDMFEGDPLLMRSFLNEWSMKGLIVVLLHCYPYHREAGYLASVFPNVYFDTSLINPLGPASVVRVLDEALELAPYSRYLFASDASTYPEMYGVAAKRFKEALIQHFTKLKDVPTEQKEQWIRMICYQTSTNLYLKARNKRENEK